VSGYFCRVVRQSKDGDGEVIVRDNVWESKAGTFIRRDEFDVEVALDEIYHAPAKRHADGRSLAPLARSPTSSHYETDVLN